MLLDLIQAAAGALTVGAGAAVLVRQRRQWITAARELERMVSDVREGKVAIEEVRKVASGRVGPVGEMVAELLHEVRRGELALAKLGAEMSQRVANRTVALERSLSSLKNQAERDSLTGLHNRRALEQAFPRVLEQCRVAGADLFVMMIDVDRFKQVNDTLGHIAGDRWIADIGRLIRSHVRETDFAFRYGGDEFVVLLPGVTGKAARALEERLVRLGGELGRTLKVRPGPGLSVGIVSLWDCPGAEAADLLKAADEALYVSKAARKSA